MNTLHRVSRFLFFFFMLPLCGNTFAQIRVNEFMASNATTIADPDYHEYADWIELYNAGGDTVNLKNYSITDDLAAPQKYRFMTDLKVPPLAYMLIWADDRGTGKHTNFKLSAGGEAIGLFSPAGQLLDSVVFGPQSTDISFGRFPNGAAQWYLFSPSTPGMPNLESGINNRLALPQSSHAGGFFPVAVSVTFSHPVAGVTLRYRRDGKEPGAADSAISGAIRFDSTGIIRVKAFKDGFLSSPALSLSFFIKDSTVLPIFSLMTDPDNFFSDTSGIYVIGTNGIIGNCSTAPRNWNQDWERPVFIDFFERDRRSGFKASAGVQIYGGCSRLYDMKSLAFYFRSQYGQDKLRYTLFPDRDIYEYNNFILRSSGQDWWRTLFRDGMVQTLIMQNTALDCQAYRPSVVFLNGKYWGVHNIREKLNEHYIGSHYPADEDNIDLVEISKGVTANNGDLNAYNAMIEFLSARSLAPPENYDSIKARVDIDNYLDYQIVQIYSANGDWPGANMKLWRERAPWGKWRWMVYDLDFTFGGNSQGMSNTNTLSQATATNGPSWPNPPWSTLMLRKLLENADFKNEFIQRFAFHIGTTFFTPRVQQVIDSIKPLIAAEITRHKARWAKTISLGSDWEANIKVMRDFAVNRPVKMREFITQKFAISGTCSIAVKKNRNEWGNIFGNGVELKYLDSAFILFKNIPARLVAVPLPGYRFVAWQGSSASTSAAISFTPSTNASFTAVFEPAPLASPDIVINEINYKSSPVFNTGDWIELYNPADSAVSLAGWKLTGNNAASYFTFPQETRINGKRYLVICGDTSLFKIVRPLAQGILGNLPFGLSSTEEHVKFTDANGTLIDEVHYSSAAPWPTEPNGNGPTLSLRDPQLDNGLPQNWRASRLTGTPGKLNDVYTDAGSETENTPAEFALFQNYPNPFNNATTITYSAPLEQPSHSYPSPAGEEKTRSEGAARVRLVVYDILGREVATLVNEVTAAGTYTVSFNAASLPSGTYFYELRAGEYRAVRKMILLR